MKCSACGRDNPPHNAFCEQCGADLRVGATEGGAPTVATQQDSGPLLIPGTSIALGDGEKVWRQYSVTRLRTLEQGQGMLYVTDSRVIFLARARGRGSQRASALIQETKLQHISGLSAYVSRKLSLFWIGATAVLGFSTIAALFSRSWLFFAFFLILTSGCVWALFGGAAKRGGVGVRIHSGATQASPIAFGEFGESQGVVGGLLSGVAAPLQALFQSATAFDVLLGFPGQDAEKMISELGALIIDLQSKGSLAGTHWGVETT
jgi:hypothetical protein